MKYIIYDIESQNYVDCCFFRTEYKDQAESYNTEAEAQWDIDANGNKSMIVIHKDDE
jgi:hypothetical protein